MKNKKFKKGNGVFEAVGSLFPEEGEPSADGLFVDCPVCQQMRKDIEMGKLVVLDGGEDGNDEN